MKKDDLLNILVDRNIIAEYSYEAIPTKSFKQLLKKLK